MLVNYLESNGLDWLPYNAKDNNGDTCLSLVCLRGFNNESDLEKRPEEVMANRLKIVTLFISRVDLARTVLGDMNNPLQWCMFYGDVDSGKMLFRARPAFLEEENGVQETLFDMFAKKRIKLYRFTKSLRLVESLCSDFSANIKRFCTSGEEGDFPISEAMKALVNTAKDAVQRNKIANSSQYQELGNENTFIFQVKDRRMNSKEGRFLSKILAVCVMLNEIKFVQFYISKLGVNPFARCLNGKNCLHYASQRKDNGLLQTLVNRKYNIIDSKQTIDLNKQFRIRSLDTRKNALHYAGLRSHFTNYEMLEDLNDECSVKLDQRAFRPIDCSRGSQFNQKKLAQEASRNRNLLLTQGDGLLRKDNHDAGLPAKFETPYLYAIVTKDHMEDPTKTLIFSQLERIDKIKQLEVAYDLEDNLHHINSPLDPDYPLLNVNKTGQLKCLEFQGKLLKVKWVQLMDYRAKSKVYYRHCFLIGLEPGGTNYLADLLNLQVFHKNKQYPDFFYDENAKFFENFRPTHYQTMIEYLLEKEFDLEIYVREGIIEQHFFLHEPLYSESILNQWFYDNNHLLFDNMKCSKTKRKYLDSFGAVNHYMGTESALFLGYSNVYTTWLILLSIVGTVTFVASAVIGADNDNPGIAALSLLICLMICLAEQFWARRQSEMVFLWKCKELAANEKPRPKHMGRLVVDPVYRSVRRKNAWSTFKRRCVTEIPISIVGILLVSCNFVVFYSLNIKISANYKSKHISSGQKTAFTILAGLGNSISMFVLNMIYVMIVAKVMKWENHRFASDEKNSLIPKLFIFGFLNYYINLLFYAFYMKDFDILTSNFISIYAFTVVSSLAYFYLAPLALFWMGQSYTLRKVRTHRRHRKDNFLSQVLADKTQLNQLSPEQQRKLLKFERDLLLWEKIEIDLIRPPAPDIMYVWMDQLFQFGFTAFFGISFPLAPLMGLFFNYVSSYLLMYTSFKICHRPRILKLKNAGIWDFLNTVMSFAALIVNAALFACVSDAFKDLFNAITSDDLFEYLVIYEHLVFFIKLLVTLLISTTPPWLAKEMLHERQKKDFYQTSEKNVRINKSDLKKESLEKEEMAEDHLLFENVYLTNASN